MAYKTWLVMALLTAALQVHIADSRQLGGAASGSSISSNPEVVRKPNCDEKEAVAELQNYWFAAESQTELTVITPLEDDVGRKLAATQPTKRSLEAQINMHPPPPHSNTPQNPSYP